MRQSHDELVQGLSYVRDTMDRMQGILREYARLKRGLREEKQPIDGSYLRSNIWALAHDVLWMVTFAGAVAIFDGFIFAVFAVCLALAHWSMSLRGGFKKLIYMAAALTAVMVINWGWLEDRLVMLAIIAAEAAVFLVRLKLRNWRIASYNRKVARSNQAAKEEMQQLAAAYHQMEAEMKEKTSSWYPLDYYNIEAAGFFLNAVRNHRAESVKEMVNLFEATAEHKKLLEFQERQAKEQRHRQQIHARKQQAIREQLEYADRMDALANFFFQYSENARQSQRDMKLNSIQQSLWSIQNDLNRR